MLTVIESAVLSDSLSVLRNKTSLIQEFRAALDKISYILCVEAIKDLPSQEVEIQTPLEKTKQRVLSSDVVIVPILRAGLSMLQAFTFFLPTAKIGFIGQKRDEETAIAVEYYQNFPDLNGSQVLVIDPMLATGGSAVATIKALINKGAKPQDIKLISVISAPEGVNFVHQNFPQVKIITAALDRCLNEKKYILPGLGDAGDLWAGT
jgi:uracil phosphoribosyltransferase